MKETASALEQLLAGYMSHLRVDRRASEHTLDATRRDSTAFIAYCAECGIHEPKRVDIHTVRGEWGAQRSGRLQCFENPLPSNLARPSAESSSRRCWRLPWHQRRSRAACSMKVGGYSS